jgi:hypothetical protein
MPRFQTVVRRARFVYSPFTAQEMQAFGQLLVGAVRVRILSGQNSYFLTYSTQQLVSRAASRRRFEPYGPEAVATLGDMKCLHRVRSMTVRRMLLIRVE